MKFKNKLLIVLVVLLALFAVSCSNSNPNSSSTAYTGNYIGNISTLKFHKDTCSYLPDTANRITFTTRQGAVDAGYSVCGHCNP